MENINVSEQLFNTVLGFKVEPTPEFLLKLTNLPEEPVQTKPKVVKHPRKQVMPPVHLLSSDEESGNDVFMQKRDRSVMPPPVRKATISKKVIIQ